MDINETLTRAAHGENRLDPDQQRQFLGTFRERVVIAVSLEQAQQEETLRFFPNFLNQESANDPNLSLKISPALSMAKQMAYLKLAQEVHIDATIVDETSANSPYGLVLHTDHAIDKENIDFIIPEETATSTKKEPEEKKSFWKKLFGN
ncbi:YueI family protein [Streptococcus caprae]|uniref:YueI family protein n=1 Tax=Streptococcus caprae TaxID=1640501 RepID=A0ABV8CXE5_9STRE